MKKFDVIIVGAGIVGIAVAYSLHKQNPKQSILIVEKESAPAQHQTGRNSGVIHAGVYYEPGSLKAKYCRQGLEHTYQLCRELSVPYDNCGKLIVATDEIESQRLVELARRCELNDLSPQWLEGNQIQQLEPNITGVNAIKVTHTGITDYGLLASRMLASIQADIDVQMATKVNHIVENEREVKLTVQREAGNQQTVKGERLICCAGVHADELMRRQGLTPDFRIIPFKGEYYRLSDKFNQISDHLIYPVPDPTMPFLGVHLTKMIGGYTTVGPNAVLALGKEAYDLGGVELSGLISNAFYPGFWRMLWQHKSSALGEIHSSISRAHYAKLVNKYCEQITPADFSPYRAGIRAQAVAKDGSLIHDFKFVHTARTLHVGNAPSPAATSAIPIALAIIAELNQ